MANKKAQSTALALADTKTADVMGMLEAELKNLQAITESAYKTSGNIDGISGNIKDEKSIPNLIKAFASIIVREDGYNAAAAGLGLTQYPAFSINGGTTEDWRADIDLRIKIITHEDRKNKLTAALDKMKSFLSQAEQREIALKEIASLISQ